MERRSILVVDDELLIRDLLYDYFQELSWDVAVVGSGKAALDKIHERDFDVLLTDLKMPEMDGSTLIDQVRKEKPDMPVIVVTGYPSVDSAVRSLRQRVDDYVTKPFNVTKLFKSVEHAIERHDNEQNNDGTNNSVE